MNSTKKYILSFSLLLTICSYTIGQNPYATTINKRNGLPSNEVYNIFQDRKGFIWIAHNEGLSKYDGHQYYNYQNKSQTSKAGTLIQEDVYGRIWYENFDGYLYYVQNDSLHALKQNTSAGFFHYGIVKDYLYTIQNNGIDVFNLKTLQLIKTIALEKKWISFTHFTADHFYIYNQDYLYRINPSNFKIETINHYNKTNSKAHGILFSNGQSILLYGNNVDDKYCYSVSKNAYSPKFKHNIQNFIQASAYTDHCYWFCTPKGAYAFDENGNALNQNKPYFEDKSISCVLRDREGNFWFSTTNEGLLFVPEIKSLLYKSKFKIKKIIALENKLIAGTENNELIAIQPETNEIEILHQDKNNKSIDFLKLDATKPMIYYSSMGFNQFNFKDNQHFTHELAVKDIFRISDKYYAYAASGACGIFAITKNRDSIWDYSIANKNKQNSQEFNASQALIKVRGKAIAYDKPSHTIFYATHTDLFAVSPKLIQSIHYNSKSLFINQLQQYEEKIFALTTQGQLLQILNHRGIKITPLQYLQTDEPIKSIKVIDQYLFITSNVNLYWLKLSELSPSIQKLDISKQNEITDLTIYKNQLILVSDGQLIFTKLEGLGSEKINPQFYIQEVKVNNRVVKLTEENKFDHLQNNISISCHILSFKTGSKFPLYYKINTGQWELLPTESRQLLLPSLSPKLYTIQFKLGEINNPIFKSTSVQFEIKKPWWQSEWAYFAFIVLAASLLYLLYKWRMNSLVKKNTLLEEKIVLEKNIRTYALKSIKAQMNPHFFYNALNTIQAFIYKDDKRNASTYLSKFSKLTRTILEMSEKETVSLFEEIEALKLYLDIEQVRFTNDFEYTIHVNRQVDIEFIKIPSMLIQPYVENAIKHGLLHKKEKKYLNLSFEKNDTTLVVQIEDNGIGRQKSEALNKIKNSGHQSFATAANLKRLNLMNTNNAQLNVEFIDKKDKDGNSGGTLVIIRIPIA